jgi:SET domain-containing protein
MANKTNSYQALPEGLTIKKSKLHGLGLFATQPIPPSQDLGISHVADDRFPNHYLRTPLGAFINYSSHPNCEFVEVDDTFRLKTLKPIAKDEELTDKYDCWYDIATLSTFKDN